MRQRVLQGSQHSNLVASPLPLAKAGPVKVVPQSTISQKATTTTTAKATLTPAAAAQYACNLAHHLNVRETVVGAVFARGAEEEKDEGLRLRRFEVWRKCRSHCLRQRNGGA